MAGIMKALGMEAEAVLMMDAILAVKLTLGALSLQERALGKLRGGDGGGRSEVIDLPGGGKKVRLRGVGIEKLGGFLKSQGLVNEL